MDDILNEEVKDFVKETFKLLKEYSKTSNLQERCRKAIKKNMLTKHSDIMRILYCMAIRMCIDEANGANFSLTNVHVKAQQLYVDSGIDSFE